MTSQFDTDDKKYAAVTADIAKRSAELTRKMMIGAGIGAVGGAAGAVALGVPYLAFHGGVLGGFAGGTAADFMQVAEREKLNLDRKRASAYIDGKGQFGDGLREEVLDKGYAMTAPVFPGIPMRSAHAKS